MTYWICFLIGFGIGAGTYDLLAHPEHRASVAAALKSAGTAIKAAWAKVRKK